MITCSNCGTMNRKGSKYCSNCGQRLDAASSIACPLCDRLNSIDSIVCRFCGAPLVPPAHGMESKLIAQQSSQLQKGLVAQKFDNSSVEPPQRELPSWLYQQPELRSSPSVASLPPQAELQAKEEGSKCLKGIRDALPGAEAWLASALKRGERNHSTR